MPEFLIQQKRLIHNERILGFIGGPDGVIDGQVIEITKELVDSYRNTGSFFHDKGQATKIDTPEKTALCRRPAQ